MTTIIIVSFITFWVGFFLCSLLVSNKKNDNEAELIMMSQLNKNLEIKNETMRIEKERLELKLKTNVDRRTK